MRVGLIVPEYRTAEAQGGGGVNSVADFLRDAFHPDWHVTIVSPRMSSRAGESRQLRSPRTWLKPVRVRRVGDISYVGASLAEWEGSRLRPRVAIDRLLSDVDVLVVVAGSPAIVGVVRRLNIPTILQVATFVDVERERAIRTATGLRRALLKFTTSWVSRIDRRELPVADLVVVENEWMLRRCEELGAQRTVLCPPGVDTARFVPPAAADPGGYLLSVSRLGDPRKDIGTLVRAYSIARDLGVTRPLLIAGRGQLPAEVVALIDELDLTPHVEVKRDLSMDDLVAILQQASFFVMSSTEEGLGLTMVEALSCGLPVVSTANEGARMVVGDSRVGELVPIGDAEALGRSIAKWCSMSNDDLGDRRSAARRRAEEVFSLAHTGDEFRRHIQSVAIATGRKNQNA